MFFMLLCGGSKASLLVTSWIDPQKDIDAIEQRLIPQLFQLIVGIGSLVSITVDISYSTPIMHGEYC